ncbi:site-specific integrase [Oceanihabitans sediminis]|uniref:Site-specific integrase n=2 Tax=Oceanihabitans sediminis TaxID=1812012 RepID=A0A368P7M5_9FLAO|nr:site-specific integrase [Oceanihabitans sediminis]
MKPDYNEPKIYTGGVDINNWSKLTKKEQKTALSKPWYVYYSFRNPETGKLIQQKRIKASANSYKTRKERLAILKPIQRKLADILDAGYNPYLKDNSHVRDNLMGGRKIVVKEEPKPIINDAPKTVEVIRAIPKETLQVKDVAAKEENITIVEAQKLVLDTKEQVLNSNSFPKFKSRINQFYRWLYENGFKETDSIDKINKKIVIQYLNQVLQKTSARTRNNARTDISTFIQTLIDNDVLHNNFVKEINKLTSKAKRNKSYNSTQLRDIKEYMEENDPLLSLFVDFIYYGFLRPIEVCRLKIGDINLIDNKMHVQAKNKLVKEKIIPKILLDKIPDLSSFSPSDYLFTKSQIGGEWEIKEGSKREYFTNRFKKVKQHFGLSVDYSLHSFRHTATTELYKKISKEPNMSPHAVKSKLMLITGHSSMSALESYLRDIDAELPEDFSRFYK